MSDSFPYDRNVTRLREYDYSHAGYYYVTMCTKGSVCLFGEIKNGKMKLNEYGKIVNDVWLDLPNHNFNIELDYYQIMPDHLHCIIIINDNITGSDQHYNVGDGSKPSQNNDDTGSNQHHNVGDGSKPSQSISKSSRNDNTVVRAGYEPAPTSHGLSEIVRQLKTFSAKRINNIRKTTGRPIWQRSFYDRIIRNDKELYEIRNYIKSNPLKYEIDRENNN